MPDTVSVLLLEDDNVQALRIRAYLENEAGARAITCTTLQEALGVLLGPHALDVILTDLNVPDSRGLDTFSALRTAAPQLPIVVLTGDEDINTAVRAIRHGAQDFLTKSELTGALLSRALRYAIERKSIAESLRRSDEKYRQLFENVADAVLTFEPETQRILDVNRAAVELFGYRHEELLERTLKDLISKRGTSRRFLRKLLVGSGEREGVVRRFLKRCGTSFPAEMYAATVQAPDKCEVVIATIRDLSRITHFKQALELSQESFRNVVEKHGDGIVVADDDGLVHFANPAAECYLRGSFTSLVGQRCALPLHPGAIAERDIVRLSGDPGIGECRCVATSWQGHPALLVSIRDITERKLMEEQMLHDALHDALTGLSNRNLFLNRLSHVLSLARRTSASFAVLLLDLDRFKYVNDGLGHLAGNELLVRFAGRMQECLRPDDTLARLGSDEFAILLESLSDPREALYLAMRIEEALIQPFTIAAQEVFISVSVGIALGPGNYTSPEPVMRDANTAMHRAKELRTAGYVVFNEEMHRRTISMLKLESNLRRALEQRELELHYQPIVELEGGTLTGFEALVRWRQADRLIGPADFIDFAEETGLILQIGWWVFEEAASQLKVWRDRFPHAADLRLSVNLSPRQFRQSALVERMAEGLVHAGIAPSSIVLEITETALIEDADEAIPLLERLKAEGFAIALDDFGTGYSSLSYLHRFPVDLVKIDRSFVGQLEDAGRNLEIVKAILSLTRVLGLPVTAEGVESRAQLECLRALGCARAQGYYLSHPLHPDDAAALLASTLPWVETWEEAP